MAHAGRLFWRLDAQERRKAALLGGWFFLTVATLWLLKSLRVAALVTKLGARQTPYVVLAGAGAVAVAVALYSVASARLSRLSIVLATTLAFAAALGALWGTAVAGGAHVTSSKAFVWATYMLVDVFAVVMVELFWTYASDVLTDAEANRLFGVIGLGGIVGGAAGGAFVDVCARAFGALNLLLAAIASVLACALLASLTERWLAPPARRLHAEPHVRHALVGGIDEVRRSGYLRVLVLVVVAYEFTATLATYGVNVVFEHANLGESDLTSLYGRLGWITSLIAGAAQIVLVPLLLPAKRIALVVPPFAMLLGVVSVLAAPILATAFALSIVDHGLNYSVQQSTRESLYVTMTDGQRYRAKAFIDMFVDRFAKACASIALLFLIAFAGGSVRVALGGSLLAVVAWFGSARWLGAHAVKGARR